MDESPPSNLIISGTLNIIEKCKLNKNSVPMWEVRTPSVVTTFLPSKMFSNKTTKKCKKLSQGPIH